MAYNGPIFAGTLANIDIGVAGALGVLNPLLAQVDLTLFGSLGVGAIQANLQAQLTAALQAQLDIGLSIANPLAGFQIALAGLAQLQAQITAALAGSIPAVSLDVTTQLSASAAFAAALEAQIGGLEALIQAGIAVRMPALTLAGQLQGALDAGPVFVISWENVPLANAGSSINSDFGAGLVLGPNNIDPSDTTYGILLVTKAPSAWVGIQALLLTT